MIRTTLTEPTLEYDVRGLLTSFYPGEEIRFLCGKDPAAFESGGETPAGADRELYVVCDIMAKRAEIRFIDSDRTPIFDCAEAPKGDRQAFKSELKRKLYGVLKKATGAELPWGTLTGIRPTNIVLRNLEANKSEEECARIMREEYLVGEEKTKLALEIAVSERKVLTDVLGADYANCAKGSASEAYKTGDLKPLADSYSLYIGIPFCPTRCMYCSFASNPIGAWRGHIGDYLASLEREMDAVAEIFAGKALHSIYIGGGTPTTLGEDELERLLDALESRFHTSQIMRFETKKAYARRADGLRAAVYPTLREFCVEAGRPDTLTREKLKVLRDHGVSRICINPQSMKQRTLDLIGREHTAEQVKEAFFLAREEGFLNINMDIILGLPEETARDVLRTCSEIETLGPEALTIHSLALKRASRLNLEPEKRILYHPAGAEDSEDAMRVAASFAKDMGMSPYYLYRQKNMAGNLENVGFCKTGFEGIYNILMMEEKENIAAIGAGTVSKAVGKSGKIERADNVKDIALYIERLPEMIERKRRLFA